MGNLDEKRISKISNSYRNGTKFLLCKNRDCKPRTKERNKGKS